MVDSEPTNYIKTKENEKKIVTFQNDNQSDNVEVKKGRGLKLKKSLSVKFCPETYPSRGSEDLEIIPDRVRSNSHFSFYCRPEFVPKPKPKPTTVKPSPMKLCRKIICNSTINKPSILNDYHINCLDCLSCPESDNEDDGSSFSSETLPFSPPEDSRSSKVEILRKEMVKVRTSTLDEKSPNEYECILKIDDLINQEKKRKKTNSLWKKHIIKQEEKNWLNKSCGCGNGGIDGRNPLKLKKTLSGNFSILGILESAANEKVNHIDLRQSSIY